jgi:hypothetical protein
VRQRFKIWVIFKSLREARFSLEGKAPTAKLGSIQERSKALLAIGVFSIGAIDRVSFGKRLINFFLLN